MIHISFTPEQVDLMQKTQASNVQISISLATGTSGIALTIRRTPEDIQARIAAICKSDDSDEVKQRQMSEILAGKNNTIKFTLNGIEETLDLLKQILANTDDYYKIRNYFLVLNETLAF